MIEGINLHPLTTHADHRGCFTEIFRDEWPIAKKFCQWNFVVSKPNVLRGVHVHHHHVDGLVLLHGFIQIALKDLRKNSKTFEKTLLVCLSEPGSGLLEIPPGVAHGFYFPEQTSYVYGVSSYFSAADEMGCRWDDPALQLTWQVNDPLLSERDIHADSYQALMASLEPYQAAF